jgi:hypothetical protein
VIVVTTEEGVFVDDELLLVEEVLLVCAVLSSVGVAGAESDVGVTSACVGLLDGEGEGEVSAVGEVVGLVVGDVITAAGLVGVAGVDAAALLVVFSVGFSVVFSSDVVGVLDDVGVAAEGLEGLDEEVSVNAPTAPDTTAEASALLTYIGRSKSEACAMAKNNASTDNNLSCRECISNMSDRYRS